MSVFVINPFLTAPCSLACLFGTAMTPTKSCSPPRLHMLTGRGKGEKKKNHRELTRFTLSLFPSLFHCPTPIMMTSSLILSLSGWPYGFHWECQYSPHINHRINIFNHIHFAFSVAAIGSWLSLLRPLTLPHTHTWFYIRSQHHWPTQGQSCGSNYLYIMSPIFSPDHSISIKLCCNSLNLKKYLCPHLSHYIGSFVPC